MNFMRNRFDAQAFGSLTYTQDFLSGYDYAFHSELVSAIAATRVPMGFS